MAEISFKRPCFYYQFRVNDIAVIKTCHTIEKKTEICVSQVLLSLASAKAVSTQKQLLISLW